MDKTKISGETVTIPRAEYEEMKAKIDWLMGQLRLSRSKAFGPSSEKTSTEVPEQLSLLFNEAEVFADHKPVEHEKTQVSAHARKRRSGSVKDILPDDVPVEIIEHRLPEAERLCPACGVLMLEIGKEVRQTLIIVPAQVKIREDWYFTYACKRCQMNEIETPIIKTPMDKPVISGSFASPEAVAHIMTQKFVMYSPIYRQELDFNRSGVMLSRQTMSNWMLKASYDWLRPVYDELHRRLLEHEVLHADETTLQVLKEPGKPPQSKSYMWLYRTSGDAKQPIVLYDYQPNRKAENPQNFLAGFSGYLHTDGYKAYHNLSDTITVVGCFAHARRKFDEAVKSLPKPEQKDCAAVIGLNFCNSLFDMEKSLVDLKTAERYEKRLELEKPILDYFFAWANTQNNCTAPKSHLGIALNYLLDQWPYLKKYLEDGRLELSNNRAERSIKPFVMGRKNFLFANTPTGATASAVIFSLIETAKENNLDPYRYLTYIFSTAPNMDRGQVDWIQPLVPWNAPESCRQPKKERL